MGSGCEAKAVWELACSGGELIELRAHKDKSKA